LGVAYSVDDSQTLNHRGDLLAFVDPTLSRGVHHRPVEILMLRLDRAPRQPQIDRRQARPVVESVGGVEFMAVLDDAVIVVVQLPAHAGIDGR